MDGTSEFRVVIASPPDREKLVAELWFNAQQWGELNHEQEQLRIEVYPRQDGMPWIFPLDVFLKTILDAKNRLVG
jgi:hypothetical protein